MPSPLSKESRQKYNVQSIATERARRFKLWEDTAKLSKLEKQSRFIGRHKSSTLNRYVEKRPRTEKGHVHREKSRLSIWPFPRLKLDKDGKKTLEWKAKSHQEAKEKDKNEEEDAGIK